MPTAHTSLAGLTISQLRYAVAIDTFRHFDRAARACHVTQPTLSMQLHKLEHALGIALFDRSRVPVVPTHVGMALLAQARTILREVNRLADIRDDASGVIEGELRLGVIPTLAPYLLPGILESLGRRFPRLELFVQEAVTEVVADGLRSDAIDIGLVASEVREAGFVSRPLFREPFVAYIGAGHRLAERSTLSVDELSADDIWLMTDAHCFRSQVLALCSSRRRSRADRMGTRDLAVGGVMSRFESSNLETLMRLVERGMGMTLLPALAVASLSGAEQRAVLVPFQAPTPSRTVRLVRRRAGEREALVRALSEAVRDAAAATLPYWATASERKGALVEDEAT